MRPVGWRAAVGFGAALVVAGILASHWRHDDADPDREATRRQPVAATADPAVSAPPVDPVAGTDRPFNILLLAIDTLRGDHLHCAGMTWLSTPHIDRLAADGIRFTNCLAPSPWTLPSFASIYTGLRPYRHGAIGGDFQRLDEGLTTMAEHLAAAGYQTAAFVSIHFMTADFGMDQGFARFVHCNSPKETGELAACVTDGALDFLRAEATAPFFLLLHMYDVHSPYLQPEPYQRMYYQGDERGGAEPIMTLLLSSRNRNPNRKSGVYGWLDGITDLQYPVRQYAAGVTYEDAQLGRILDYLRAAGLYDNLLIVLVSDHGEHLGEHDIFFTHFCPYQETLHVPLIVKLPGNRWAGRAVTEAVSSMDVLPTVLELAGLSVPDTLDGRSLGALIVGERDDGTSLLVAEWGAQPEEYVKTVVEWPWKLMLFCENGALRRELYDLAADPLELRDIAGRKTAIVNRLERRLWSLMDRRQPLLATPVRRPAGLDGAARERLRSLGYVD